MEWLAQNWIWIIFIIGFFFLMRRGGREGGMNRHDHHDGNMQHSPEDNSITSVTDPVNHATLDSAVALNSIYRRKIYYFASAANRAIFEAKPEQYIGSDPN